MLGFPLHVVDNVYMCPSTHSMVCGDEFVFFQTQAEIRYEAFQDDFGPMNLGSINLFCKQIERELQENPVKLALSISGDAKDLTNATFLLGAYLLMIRNMDVENILQVFDPIQECLLTYRDVSYGPQNFHLVLEDCWGGLARAKKLGWANFEDGSFSVEEYFDLDNPLNADLHEVIPGKMIAFRGPRDIEGGAQWVDSFAGGDFSHRTFSPDHYVAILRQFDVQLVVRLNDPQYDASAFHRAGIAVADLFFDDCTEPPVDVASKFLALAEAIPGSLAVHCKAGLGRTGTLIGLHLMRRHGFSAREAMAWLRVVRPGSVIGPQQEFLCRRERLMRRSSSPLCGVAAPPPGAPAGEVQRCADGIAAAIDAQYARALAAHGLTAVRRAASEQPSASSKAADLAGHVAGAAERRARVMARQRSEGSLALGR